MMVAMYVDDLPSRSVLSVCFCVIIIIWCLFVCGVYRDDEDKRRRERRQETTRDDTKNDTKKNYRLHLECCSLP